MLAILIAAGYQFLLNGPVNLEHYVLHGSDGNGSRDGIIDANREGMISCLGYLAIYFVGVQLGQYIFKPR